MQEKAMKRVKWGSIWGGASSQLRAARRIGRPTPQCNAPPQGACADAALLRPFFGRDAFVAWLVAKPLHRPSRAPGGPELEVLGNDESWQPRL